VSEVYWINDSDPPHLAIVMRPQGDKWLDEELREVRQSGIDMIVSLLEPREAEWLGLGDEKNAASRAGIEFLSYPIPDTQVPRDVAAFREFVAGIAERLTGGEHVGVHCRGCIGRATVTAACTLIHLGWKPALALTAIERARGVPVPDTQEQQEWILRFRPRT
jgi:protein-tyrosine phosphatase